MSETEMVFCNEPMRFEPGEPGGVLTVTGDPDLVAMFEDWLRATVRAERKRYRFDLALLDRLDRQGFMAYLDAQVVAK